jgi:hypothetical protein
LNWKQFLASHKEALFTICIIFFVSLVSFGTFNSGILSSDDWSYFVAKYVFGTLHPINLSDRRPFILVLYYGLASLFGLQFQYYYFFNFLILFLSALMVYAILKRAFPAQAWMASLVALAYLIYPVDYTRTWLIMIYIRFWWLVSLGVIWLLMEYAASGKVWLYAIAALGIAIPLGAYEGQFGIILLASALIAYFANKAPLKRRLVILAGTIGIGFAFLLWRIYLQAWIFKIKDTYVETLQFSPVILVERYLHGLYIFFIGWLNPIQAQLKFMGVNIIPWVLVYIAICTATLVWISARTSTPSKLEAHHKISLAKSYFIIFLVGSALWVAGYIPIIALYRPALAIVSSRINSFAVPGAALMLVSGLAILATFVANSTLIKRSIVIAAVLPFIMLGIFVQLEINQENQIKWDTQRTIWNRVFAAIPNIQDQSGIVVIIPGYQNLRPFESFPFLSGWEIEAGAQILYNNPNIGGNYYYKDIQPVELLFTKNGFRPIPTDKIIPYKKLIFVFYDPQDNTVTLVKNLEDMLSLPFSVNNYNPLENIISAEPSTAEFRWLVE